MPSLEQADPCDPAAAEITWLQLQLSNYSATSVVSAAMQTLHETKPRTLQDVQAAPWLTLLLVKWALQDSRVPMYTGQPISQAQFHRMRQTLWDMTGVAKRGPENVMAMMRSIMPAQVEFQRRAPWAFLRWPSLIARLPPDHLMHMHFAQNLGLSPEEFIDACWIASTPIVNGGLEVDVNWIASVPSSHRECVLKLLNLLGSDLLGLRQRMSASGAAYHPSSWELFEIPFARRYPFYRAPNGNWQIWHPTMFERALEDAAHLMLTPLGSAYTESFSSVFEEYVVELAREMCPHLVDEKAWWKQAGRGAPAVEAILPLGPVTAFVESKMSLFHDAVLIEDIPEKLLSRLERVTSAVQQGQKVSVRLREHRKAFPRRAEAAEEYLIVVTSREMHIGGGVALSRLINVDLQSDDANLAQRMPLENIFVMSIEAFERLRGVVQRGQTDLVTILRTAAARNRDVRTSAMYFDDHLKPYVRGGWGTPPMFKQQRDAATLRIKAAFGAG